MHYAFRKNCWENYEKAQYEGVGKYDMPEISPTDFVPDELLKFNYRGNAKDKSRCALHFYMYDYLFMSVWHFPERHIEDFRKYGAIITPDFSDYNDFPIALRILAHYRQCWIGRYYQEHGVTVIPNVSWSGEESYDFCFDGLPKNSVIATSSIGMTRRKDYQQIFRSGWKEMLTRLEPTVIILYGERLEGLEGNIVQFSTCKEQYKNDYDKKTVL